MGERGKFYCERRREEKTSILQGVWRENVLLCGGGEKRFNVEEEGERKVLLWAEREKF